MHFLRPAIISVADQPLVSSFVTSSTVARTLVDRFVAGETLDNAMPVCRDLASSGLALSLDQLGENVASETEARDAVSMYIETLQRMRAAGFDPNISVKLTMLGLDIDAAVARSAIADILVVARNVGGFVRIDMEGSANTQRTMDMFETMHDDFPEHVGIVIQSYLRRAEEDVRWCIDRGARVRLVKGAYAEPSSIAFQGAEAVDGNFVRLMELLLDKGSFPALATHDPALIRSACGYASRMHLPKESFEFQMLYGARRDEQQRLADEGYGMRVYVPYGTAWYPYFSRRIAERPANALFVLRQLLP